MKEKLRHIILETIYHCDIANIGENGFNTEEEVYAFYEDKDNARLVEVFDQYYGVKDFLIDALNGEME